MTDKKVWLITGAGRGLGVAIAKAALAADHAVVATGRDPGKVTAAIGAHDNLLAVKLDVTRAEDASAAVETSVGRFGRIDVLGQQRGQLLRGLFRGTEPGSGPPPDRNAAVRTDERHPRRAGMQAARRSIAHRLFDRRHRWRDVCTAYAVAKFGIEGWMESLAPEIAPFGIQTMLVEPGFFRTELLTLESTTFAEPYIDDYAERTRETVAAWSSMNGKQGGDPAKLAMLLCSSLVSRDPRTLCRGRRRRADLRNQGQCFACAGRCLPRLVFFLAHDDR